MALALVPRVWRGLRALPARLWGIYAGIGALVALHWLTFYGAIKLANASVAVTCLALATVFVPLVEPWVTGKRFEPRELLLGVAVVPGVALVVGGFALFLAALYLIGALSHLVARVFGGKGTWYAARLSLFWALLAVTPALMFLGLLQGFLGQGGATRAVGGLVLLSFLYLWIRMLIEAES